MIVVRPGEKIPLDGRVQAGDSHVNQAPVTGESLPVEKTPGAEVFAGTINGRGALDVVVTRLRRDSTLARIIHLVERAQAQRAPSQTFVDRFARIYTPVVLVLAVLVAMVAPLLLGGSWGDWIYRSLVLLVISCPCALVISTPVSIVSALAAAARKGVLIKGGARLERLAAVRCVAFDKTGTLTHGRLQVVDVACTNGLGVAGGAASRGLARTAIRASDRPRDRRARSAGQPRAGRGRRFPGAAGAGAEGLVGAERVVVGSHRLFEERGLCSARAHAAARADGGERLQHGDGRAGQRDRRASSASPTSRGKRRTRCIEMLREPGGRARGPADRRSRGGRAGARRVARHHGLPGVAAARGQGHGGRGAARTLRRAGDGRRRRQRCAGARGRRRRHRDGRRRHRRRARDRRRRADGRRAGEDSLRHAPEPRRLAQHHA